MVTSYFACSRKRCTVKHCFSCAGFSSEASGRRLLRNKDRKWFCRAHTADPDTIKCYSCGDLCYDYFNKMVKGKMGVVGCDHEGCLNWSCYSCQGWNTVAEKDRHMQPVIEAHGDFVWFCAEHRSE